MKRTRGNPGPFHGGVVLTVLALVAPDLVPLYIRAPASGVDEVLYLGVYRPCYGRVVPEGPRVILYQMSVGLSHQLLARREVRLRVYLRPERFGVRIEEECSLCVRGAILPEGRSRSVCVREGEADGLYCEVVFSRPVEVIASRALQRPGSEFPTESLLELGLHYLHHVAVLDYHATGELQFCPWTSAHRQS